MKKTSATVKACNTKDNDKVWEELRIGLDKIICERGIDALEAVNAKVNEPSDLIQMYCYGLMDGVRLGMHRYPQKAKEIAELIDELRQEHIEIPESWQERQEWYKSVMRKLDEAAK